MRHPSTAMVLKVNGANCRGGLDGWTVEKECAGDDGKQRGPHANAIPRV